MPKSIVLKPEPACPDCGARMKLRTPRTPGAHFDPFWGCSRYPDCHGKRNIDEDGKPEEDYEEWEVDA